MSAKKTTFRPTFDTLEDRCMMAADWTGMASGGVLQLGATSVESTTGSAVQQQPMASPAQNSGPEQLPPTGTLAIPSDLPDLQTPRSISPTLVVITYGFQASFETGGRYSSDSAKSDWLNQKTPEEVHDVANSPTGAVIQLTPHQDWLFSLASKVETELRDQAPGMPLYFLLPDWDTFGQSDIPADKIAAKIMEITGSTAEKWDVLLYGHSRGAIFNHRILDHLSENANIDYIQMVMLDPTASKLQGDEFPENKQWQADAVVNYNDGHKFGTSNQLWEHLMPDELLANRTGRAVSDFVHNQITGAMSMGIVPIIQTFKDNLVEDGFDISGARNEHIHDEMHRDLERFKGDGIVDSANPVHGLSQHMQIQGWYEHSHRFTNDLSDFLTSKDGGNKTYAGGNSVVTREMLRLECEKIVLRDTVEYILNVARDFTISALGEYAWGSITSGISGWSSGGIGMISSFAGSHVSGAITWVNDQSGRLGDLANGQIRAAADAFQRLNESLGQAFYSQVGLLDRAQSSSIDKVLGASNSATRSLANRFRHDLERAADSAERALSRGLNSARSSLTSQLDTAKRSINQQLTNARNALSQPLNDARQAIAQSASDARKTISDLAERARKAVSDQKAAMQDAVARTVLDALKQAMPLITKGAGSAQVQLALRDQLSANLKSALDTARANATRQVEQQRQSAENAIASAKAQIERNSRSLQSMVGSIVNNLSRSAGDVATSARQTADRIVSDTRREFDRKVRSGREDLTDIVNDATRRINDAIRKLQLQAEEAARKAREKVKRVFRW